MKTCKFHLGDVLTIVTGRSLSPRGQEGVMSLVNFMMEHLQPVATLPDAFCVCEPYLTGQFPQFDSQDMTYALGELDVMLNSPAGKKNPTLQVVAWLSEMTSGKYGIKCKETLNVKQIPKPKLLPKNPAEEFKEVQSGWGGYPC